MANGNRTAETFLPTLWAVRYRWIDMTAQGWTTTVHESEAAALLEVEKIRASLVGSVYSDDVRLLDVQVGRYLFVSRVTV